MNLEAYNELAYQFAIRNTRVIELLKMPLNHDVIKELLTFGIDATSTYFHEGEEKPINSTQELYLNYAHLHDLKHSPCSPYGEGCWEDEDTGETYNVFEGKKRLVHPLSKNIFSRQESYEDSILRIKSLIETRGRSSKIKRLMDGTVFEHYDAITFFGETVYSLDPSTNTARTIRNDIKFVKEWINPDKYLQLIPQYKHWSD